MENAKYGGFVKASEVERAISDAKRQYGFTQALDPQFAKWYVAAKKSRGRGPVDEQMMAGTKITFGEGRKRTLRAKVKEACARLHGVTVCQNKK